MNLMRHLIMAVLFFSLFLKIEKSCAGQDNTALGIGNWFTFAGNIAEAGYRKTQFFDHNYNTAVFQWEARAEFWLRPSRDKFSWGPYIRVAGIAGSKSDAWQNAWLGVPGVGFQVYPLSSWRFQRSSSILGKMFGPLRMFGEYNWTHYWGSNNSWRPRRQTRVGFEYWKALNVNEPSRFWWVEIWSGLYWQSSNEFTYDYKTVKLGNAWRSGIRKRHNRVMSTITPYLALDSSRTKYDYAGTNHCIFIATTPNPCDFYWENRLLIGGGLRYAPSLVKFEYQYRAWLNRLVVYGEYLTTVAYYGPSAPPSVPRFDVRVGVSTTIGQWYK